jgi:hypothetical protein
MEIKNTDIDFENIFDFKDIDNIPSDEEYVNTIISLLQPILSNVFINSYAKQNIRKFRDRINFACPYCMDSTHDDHKKRGNIILSGKHKNHFKCHNCGEYKRVDIFFKDFNTVLDLGVVNYISNNIENFWHIDNSNYNISILLNDELINKFAINREILKEKLHLIEVKNSKIWKYLIGRLQFDESKFLYSENENYLLILNLNKNGDIIGAQKRLFIKSNDRFRTHTLTFLYELIGNKDIKIPEELDILSGLFNICFININRPITLFEGPMDAFLFHNSVGNAGAQKHFPFDLPLRYFFDDDATGREKSLKYIDEGKPVFLWTKFKLDNNITFNRVKLDLNDTIIWAKKNDVKLTRFDNYFSDDPLDSIDI